VDVEWVMAAADGAWDAKSVLRSLNAGVERQQIDEPARYQQLESPVTSGAGAQGARMALLEAPEIASTKACFARSPSER
jgi:hypothetical protein